MLNSHPQPRAPPDSIYGHSRTRTSSSGAYPITLAVQSTAPLPAQHMQYSRRSPSVGTFSTTSTVAPPAAYRTSPTTDLRRSTSSRSGGASPALTSYVAALRRQKGTVWCDRAQPEDPRQAYALRQAKLKANAEMIGPRVSAGYNGTPPGRTSTGISATGKVAAKIRHHGKPAVVGYTPGENHVGVGGVPPRLSATEVEGESTDDDEAVATRQLHHRRTGSSGRSSTASGRRGLGYRSSGGLGSQRDRRWSPGGTPERTSSMVDGAPGARQEEVIGGRSDAASGKARSTGSGSSAERADNVGELGNAARLASNSLIHSAITREKSVKSAEELKRRGSVDERTATMSAGRLYIANPD